MNLPQLPVDKANHYIYGQILYAAIRVLTSTLPNSKEIAFAGTTAIGVLKECVDKYLNTKAAKAGTEAPHGVEFLDAAATAAGAASLYAAESV